MKKSGHMWANCKNMHFFFYLVNWPVLMLKCNQGNNGKFVGTKKSGHLYTNCENTHYFFYLFNRPVLVFKRKQFVSLWSPHVEYYSIILDLTSILDYLQSSLPVK